MADESNQSIALREGVRSLQFFVAAMAAQLHEMHDSIDRIPQGAPAVSTALSVTASSPELASDLAAAREEAAGLRDRVAQLEHQVEFLQEELERRHISFEDHHAAKQEIMQLRSEVERLRGIRAGDDEPLSLRKRWSMGRSSAS